MSDPNGDERDLQAAEYVIGLLPPNQSRAVETLALSEPAMAASIAAWQERLAPLAELVAPVPPPASLWSRLALATGIETVALGPPTARRGQRPSLWRGAALWRATTAAAVAAAAVLAFMVYDGRVTFGRPEPLTAVLTPGSSPAGTFLVQVGQDGRATVIALGDITVPQGRALQLWSLAGSGPPVSLGLLPPAGRRQLRLDASPGTQLLVSEEQSGGSPTGQPTTTPIYAGRLTGI